MGDFHLVDDVVADRTDNFNLPLAKQMADRADRRNKQKHQNDVAATVQTIAEKIKNNANNGGKHYIHEVHNSLHPDVIDIILSKGYTVIDKEVDRGDEDGRDTRVQYTFSW